MKKSNLTAIASTCFSISGLFGGRVLDAVPIGVAAVATVLLATIGIAIFWVAKEGSMILLLLLL